MVNCYYIFSSISDDYSPTGRQYRADTNKKVSLETLTTYKNIKYSKKMIYKLRYYSENGVYDIGQFLTLEEAQEYAQKIEDGES